MTEKDYKPQKSEGKEMVVKIPKKIAETKAQINNKIINKKNDEIVESKVKENKRLTTKKISEPIGEAKKPSDSETDKEEKKKPIIKKPIKKKTQAFVNGNSLPISTKQSVAICKFIKGKKINDAIEYLEKVVVGKKAIPMRGEIPHRKGKMMSGRFPKNASQQFIKLLKSLGANANANNLEEPIISEAIANKAQRPYGRFGRTQKKRSHVLIKCKEKKVKE